MNAMVRFLKLIRGQTTTIAEGAMGCTPIQHKTDHRSLPEEHEYSRFGYLIASDPATPSYVLAIMADCEVPALQERIAFNPNADAEVLHKLACSESVAVRQAVAEHPNAPVTVLMRLARDESVDVRFRLAENYGAPYQVLEILTEDENPYVECRALETLARKFPQSRPCFKAA